MHKTQISHEQLIAVEEFTGDLREALEGLVAGEDLAISGTGKIILNYINNLFDLYKKRFDLFAQEEAVYFGKDN